MRPYPNSYQEKRMTPEDILEGCKVKTPEEVATHLLGLRTKTDLPQEAAPPFQWDHLPSEMVPPSAHIRDHYLSEEAVDIITTIITSASAWHLNEECMVKYIEEKGFKVDVTKGQPWLRGSTLFGIKAKTETKALCRKVVVKDWPPSVHLIRRHKGDGVYFTGATEDLISFATDTNDLYFSIREKDGLYYLGTAFHGTMDTSSDETAVLYKYYPDVRAAVEDAQAFLNCLKEGTIYCLLPRS